MFKKKSMIFASLATICSVLVVIFTYLSTRETKRESDLAEENLRKSVGEVSEALQGSLKETSKVVEDINNLGSNLTDIKRSLSNSLDEAKRFQELVDEELRMKKEQFELEKANFISVSEKIEFLPKENNSSQYYFSQRISNLGLRGGYLKSFKCVLLNTDKDLNIIDERFASFDEPNTYLPAKIGYFIIGTVPFLHLEEDLKSNKNKMVYVVMYVYEDESIKKEIVAYDYAVWNGYKDSGFGFYDLLSSTKEKFNNYLKKRFEL